MYYFQVYAGYYSFLVGHLRYSNGTSDEGLGDEAIIGLTVGSVVSIVVIAIIISHICYNKRKRKEKHERNTYATPDGTGQTNMMHTDMVHMAPL